jgi:hypothetical protein
MKKVGNEYGKPWDIVSHAKILNNKTRKNYELLFGTN